MENSSAHAFWICLFWYELQLWPLCWTGRCSLLTLEVCEGLDETTGTIIKITSPKENIITHTRLLLQYGRVYDILRTFCQNNNLPEFGAGQEPLAACLSLLMTQDGSYSKELPSPTNTASVCCHRLRLMNWYLFCSEAPVMNTLKTVQQNCLSLKKSLTRCIHISTNHNMDEAHNEHPLFFGGRFGGSP